MVTITKTLEDLVVAPSPRWPAASRLSQSEKTAIETWCREVYTAFSSMRAAIKELQTELKKLDE